MARKIKFAYAEGKRVQITNEQKREIKRMYNDVLGDIKTRQAFLSTRTNISSIMRMQYLNDLSKAIKDNIIDIDRKTEKMIIENM